MRQYLLVSTFVFLVTLSLYAQNSEKAGNTTKDKDESQKEVASHWIADVTGSLEVSDGDNNKKEHRLLFEFESKIFKDTVKIFGEFNEHKVEEDTSERNSLYGVEYNFYVTEQSDLQLGYEIEKDRFRRIERKDKVYSGVNKHLIKEENTKLNLEYGGTWIHEKYVSRFNLPTKRYWALRTKSDFKHKWADSKMEIFQKTEYIPSVENSREYFITAFQGLRNELNASWTLENSVKLKYVNNLPRDQFGQKTIRTNGHKFRRLNTDHLVSLRLSF